MFVTLVQRMIRERFRDKTTWILFAVQFILGFSAILLTLNSGGPLYKNFNAGMNAIKANSPFILYYMIASVFQYSILVTVFFFGKLGIKDFTCNTYQLIFSSPIKKITYIAANLISETTILFFVFSGIGLGAGMASAFNGSSPLILDNPASAYILPYITNILPNLLIFGMISYLLTLHTRKIYPVYVITVITVITKILSSYLMRSGQSLLANLMDPFGLTATAGVIKDWSIVEKNTLLLSFQNDIVINRIFWFIIIASLCIYIMKKIHLYGTERFTKNLSKTQPDIHYENTASEKEYSSRGFWFTIKQLAMQDFLSLCNNKFFLLITSLGVLMFLIVGFQYVGIVRNTQTYPVTYEVLRSAGNIFTMFIFFIIAFVTAETVWRDREAKIFLVTDALPVANSVWIFGKLISVSMIIFLLMSLIMITGILIQLLHGFYTIDFGQYLVELFVIRWVQYSMIALLSVVLQVIAPQKLFGYIMVIIFYAMQDIVHEIISEHYLVGFSDIMPIVYSDMNGFGPYLKRALIFNGYWAGLSVLFTIIAIGLWKNGYILSVKKHIAEFASHMTKAIKLSALAGLLCVLIFGSFAYYNTNVLNQFSSQETKDLRRAQYEKTYKKYDTKPYPTIIDVSLHAELYPSQQYCVISGTLQLQNKTNQSITELFIEMPEGSINTAIQLSKRSTVKKHDIYQNVYIVELGEPLIIDDIMSLQFSLIRENKGFANSGVTMDIIKNGSFMNAYEIMPAVGYNVFRMKELQDDAKRQEYGLEPKNHTPLSIDEARTKQWYYKNCSYARLHFTIGTDNDQIPIAPGTCIKKWEENNRIYVTYDSEKPILNYFSILSGRYSVVKDSWDAIPIEIYYHPSHTYNLALMLDAVKKSLAYYTEHFGPYPFSKLQIVEFPRYMVSGEAFPGVIPLSEGYGFIAKFKPDTVEYLYRVVAHEVGHQWWGMGMTTADYPGSQMLTETATQYSAMMVIKKHYSQQAIDAYLKYTIKDYFRGRSMASNFEPSLMTTLPEHAYVHYDKGIVVMNALQEYIGEKNCNTAFNRLYTTFATGSAPYPVAADLYNEIKAVTPEEYGYLIDEWFNNVTFYDIGVTKATFVAIEQRSYTVTIAYDLEKYSLTASGDKQPIETNTHVQVSIYEKSGEVYKKIILLQNKSGEITVPVSFQPASVGLNDHFLLIEKVWSDNTMKCMEQN